MRIIVVGGYGFGNLGDEAFLSVILKHLKKRVNEVTVFSYDPEETERLHRVNARYLMGLKALSELVRADMIIIGSGGIFDTYVAHSLNRVGVYALMIAFLSKLLAKKLVFHSIGANSLRNPLMKMMALIAISLADSVSVRDIHSKKVLKSLGVKREVQVSLDPALKLESVSVEEARRLLGQEGVDLSKFLVGLSLRSMGNSRMNERLVKTMAQVADWLIEEFDAEVVFILMSRQKYKHVENDQLLTEKVHRLVNHRQRVKILKKRYTPQDVKGIIGLMDFFIGMRLHSLTFAHSMGIPFIALVYHKKVSAFLEMIGQRDRIEFSEVSFEKLREVMKQKIKNS